MRKLAMLIWLLIGVVLGKVVQAAPQLTAPLPVWQQQLAAQAPGLSPTVLKLALTALQHASSKEQNASST